MKRNRPRPAALGPTALVAACALATLGCQAPILWDGPTAVVHKNPPELHRGPTFSQVVTVEGPHRLVFVGGQTSVDAQGIVQGRGNIARQAEQVFQNLVTALHAGGARLHHVVRWTVYVVAGQPALPVFQTFQRLGGELPQAPTISVVYVTALAHPDFLVAVEAIAAVPSR